MKKVWLLIAIFLGGLMVGFILPVEWRGKLSRPLTTVIGGMVEHMPDDGPGKVVLSGVLQTLEQNIQLFDLLQEQQ